MDSFRLILNSLRFHARSHLGTILGAAIGSAALIGALIVGDSVRASLRGMALDRVGKADYALVGNDRFFRADLADDLKAIGTAAPVLQVAATVSANDNSARANQVQVLGVDDRFWQLSSGGTGMKLPSDGVVLNQRLAHQLNTKGGETVLLRILKPSLLSRESPISPQEDSSVVLRLKVAGIANDGAFGRFSLQANQIPPFNAYLPIELLQKRVELPGKANLLLVNRSSGSANPNDALRAAWQLADAQLQLVSMTNQPGFELRSERVFLEKPVIEASTNNVGSSSGVLTYFVNELRLGERATPYSIVAATESPVTPLDLRHDEILLNEWVAEDLGAKVGQQISLSYYVPGSTQQLIERTNTFRVRSIVPIEGAYADRTLMPEFPGIAKAEKTENWDAGFTIDMNRIRPKDEKYWEDYRGTPKAFISLAAGKEMWSNRFGELTAIRFSGDTDREQLESSLRTNMAPESLGLMSQDIRSAALSASTPAQDFGQLFLGLSFFLIVAALILMALLYQFSIEQRIQETGTLLALGFRPGQVRNLLLLEGSGLALIGGALGAVGGLLYGWAMLRGLATIWQGATGSAELAYHASLPTLLIGFFASFVVCVVTVILVIRKQANQPARLLLSGDPEPTSPGPRRSRKVAEWVAVVSVVGALLLVGISMGKKDTANAGVFFGAGAMLLLAGLAGAAALLKRLGRNDGAPNLTLMSLGLRNASRRSKRSLATMALLACGTFLVISVGAFRLETNTQEQRSSGTGGFALIGETAFPVVKDLNQPAGLEAFGLDQSDLPEVSFVSLRVKPGDDASCLNLNSAQKPRLLGLNSKELASREAFTFAKVLGEPTSNPWSLLTNVAPDEVPAIGDDASITWAMRKKVGDVLIYSDERGRAFKVRIVASVANSILQGSLLIDEQAFMQRFPSEPGYRMFLIDAPSNERSNVNTTLSRALRDVGLELTPAAERLAAFNAVQNTYLNTFQVLGGLGLLLGSAGLGIVVLRNVFERRSEFAALKALGFTRVLLRRFVLNEHLVLLLFGLGVGIVAAVVSILPSLLASREVPAAFLALLLGAIFVSGMLSTLLAVRWSLRGEILRALQNE